MIEMLLIVSVTVAAVCFIVSIHYNGYKKGYKSGFMQGRTRINEYALKVNQALNERVAELQSARNDKRTK
ncbi:hypothetical protein SPD48_09625 [Pseudogracilibacillus sp. SE30717A]|uniref:hypothetical protein n=1 Tax=Pseudogracilibacillus sp. SE30717A TaxID=3098293 RepID=UPI00300E21DC